ncbi:MAG: hypothetical protein GZ086_04825 [Gelidibacter sp.]|nr:hypothetical protein [Gelidibacter sp.]
MKQTDEIKVQAWIENLQANGKNAFALEVLEKELPNYSAIALKRTLNRLSEKGNIFSVFKGYYLIITPQYASKGILPPYLYIDGLMKHLERPYYVGLINAAAFHGASHQQAQEFFVFTILPTLRPTLKKGQKINYISISNINPKFLIDIKTEIGYLKVSNPILTATDLIQFEKKIGGLNRAATVLEELTEKIIPEHITADIINHVPVSTWQRLGYILEHVIEQKELSNDIFQKLMEHQKKLFRIPLKASGLKNNFPTNDRWKIIINTTIETDF